MAIRKPNPIRSLKGLVRREKPAKMKHDKAPKKRGWKQRMA